MVDALLWRRWRLSKGRYIGELLAEPWNEHVRRWQCRARASTVARRTTLLPGRRLTLGDLLQELLFVDLFERHD